MTDAADFVTESAAATRELGARLGRTLRGGEGVALDGPLGAGKTEFTKGLAIGVGVSTDEVIVSPTFVLIREYPGRLNLIHLDLYRLSGAEELETLGFSEIAGDPANVLVVEWAARIPEIRELLLWRVRIDYRELTTRNIRVEGPRELLA
ncbi:MAG: tRNA (adenosine(37)-N6)-threonylcarbamoyltransferase complex ATPase subunit type 1 TsaE [Phycisphaerae bacterium]